MAIHHGRGFGTSSTMRDALRRAEHERDRLKRRNEHFEEQLDAARPLNESCEASPSRKR
jgi:hypothetical protein